jgi:hypothetical protein
MCSVAERAGAPAKIKQSAVNRLLSRMQGQWVFRARDVFMKYLPVGTLPVDRWT